MPLRKSTLPAIVFLSVIVSLIGSACAATSPTGAPAGSQPASFPVNIDPATYVIVTYQRTGGVAGDDSTAQLFLDGHVELVRRSQAPTAFQLSAAEQAQIEAAFEAADFYRNTQQVATPKPVPADAYQIELTRRGALLQGTLRTHEADVPAWARSLLPLLDTLLLSPIPAQIAAYRPGAPVPEVISPTLATPLPAPELTLVEFVRQGASGDERLLVNIDRSYSVARNGSVQAGQLTEDEMATLLKMLEDANLRERRGDYFAETACDSCAGIELVYRNLFGAYKVRSQEGAGPAWLQAIANALIDTFFLPDQIAARPLLSPAAGVALTATLNTTSTVLPPPATPQPMAAVTAVATQIVTPVTTTTATAVALEQPKATATTVPAMAATDAYGLADLIGDLVMAGAKVAPQPGRIVKPYLSTNGIVVTVDGQPVQVFEYESAAALADDVSGLAPDASTIDGVPVTWQASPHFWRRGTVLALAVSDDAVLVDQLSRALGQPFAGAP